MIFLKILSLAIVLILVGGFGYFAITDVPVQQTQKVETLPASHFNK